MLIRPYSPGDVGALTQCHNAAVPREKMTPEAFGQILDNALKGQGYCRVVEVSNMAAGYALAMPVPGLTGVYDLQGCIDPAWRRHGYGSRLLGHVIEGLGRRGGQQISHAVSVLEDPAARFLQKRGFYVEHVEARMQLDRLDSLEATPIPTGFALRRLPGSEAIGQFLRLYELAFAGRPWYQPYSGAAEVGAELADLDDMLFLNRGREPVGFIWLRWPAVNASEFEPVGIAPAYQGRGLARPFLLAGIRQAAEQGADTVTLGVWENNAAALRLYQSLGFRRTESLSFLAFDLQPG